MIRNLVKETQQLLTCGSSLEILGMSRRGMSQLLNDFQWKKTFEKLAKDGDFSAGTILGALKPVMDTWAAEPQGGWLGFICEETKSLMYPENYRVTADEGQKRAKYFFMENYRALLGYEREIKGFSPTDQIEFLDDDEVRDCMTFKEYERLKEFWSGSYIFEFMRISREITPFNTVGHIGGVHHVATFVGKQLAGTDIPVDMALLSGAAAGHDIGKMCIRDSLYPHAKVARECSPGHDGHLVFFVHFRDVGACDEGFSRTCDDDRIDIGIRFSPVKRFVYLCDEFFTQRVESFLPVQRYQGSMPVFFVYYAAHLAHLLRSALYVSISRVNIIIIA